MGSIKIAPSVLSADMANLKGENDKFIILDIAQNAVISHPVSPNAGLVAHKPLAESAGVFAPIEVFQEP